MPLASRGRKVGSHEARRTVQSLAARRRGFRGRTPTSLRAAGITHPDQVLAVVLESTGDVSVLKASDNVDLDLFSDVRGVDRLRQHLARAEAAGEA